MSREKKICIYSDTSWTMIMKRYAYVEIEKDVLRQNIINLYRCPLARAQDKTTKYILFI
jgi:hypothetical protein